VICCLLLPLPKCVLKLILKSVGTPYIVSQQACWLPGVGGYAFSRSRHARQLHSPLLALALKSSAQLIIESMCFQYDSMGEGFNKSGDGRVVNQLYRYLQSTVREAHRGLYVSGVRKPTGLCTCLTDVATSSVLPDINEIEFLCALTYVWERETETHRLPRRWVGVL
jgi:hypothetical protein